jgi:hypothetical protein
MAMVALALSSATARAAVTISSFSLTPTTTQAGSDPGITIDAKLSTGDGDTPNALTVSLAPGLLADPNAATICSASDFQAQTCPSSSEIGDGTITGFAPSFGTSLALPVQMYLIQPAGSEVARIGVITDFFDQPAANVSAPVTIRTTPSVGIDIPMTGIPDQIQGVAIQIQEITLDLFATVNGTAFTRNPTSCAPATSTISLETYASPSTPVSASSSFTPTGCASLAYKPQLATAATVDSGDDGVAFAATVTQGPGEAATSSLAVTLPSGLGPRLSAVTSACTATDLTTCPAIGSATVTTPLLSAPVAGRLVLAARSGGGLPLIDAVFPSPLGLTLSGTPSLGGAGLTASFAGIPDVPLTSLAVNFAGGPDSLLTANSALCAGGQAVSGAFTAQSGATASVNSSVAVSGACPAGTPGGSGNPQGSGNPSGNPQGSGSPQGSGNPQGTSTGQTTTPPPGGTPKPGKPTATVKAGRLTGKSPSFTVVVGAGSGAAALGRVVVRLPGGVTLRRAAFPHGIAAKLDRKALPARAVSPAGGLTLTLGKGGRALTVTLGSPTLRLSAGLLSKLRHHKPVTLRFSVVVRDASGAVTTLRESVRVL